MRESTAAQVLSSRSHRCLAPPSPAEVGLAGATWRSTLCGAVAAAPACLLPLSHSQRLPAPAPGPLAGISTLNLAPFPVAPTCDLEVGGRVPFSSSRSWALRPPACTATELRGWVLAAQALDGASPVSGSEAQPIGTCVTWEEGW